MAYIREITVKLGSSTVLRGFALVAGFLSLFLVRESVAETPQNATREDVSVTGTVTGVAWSHDGSRIAVTSGEGHYIEVLDGNGRHISDFKRLFNGPDPDDAVAVTKDTVILPPQYPPPYLMEDPTRRYAVSLWNANDGTFLRNVEGSDTIDTKTGYNWADHIALNPDDSLAAIASAAAFGPIFLFSRSNWKIVQTLGFMGPHGHLYGADEIAFSSDGRTLVAAVDLGYIEVVDIASGKMKRLIDAFPDHNHMGSSSGLALSPQDHLVAISSGDLRIIDYDTGKQIAVYNAAGPGVHKLAWNASGDTIAIASGYHTLHLWQWREDRPAEIIHMDGAAMSLAYSPDGSRLAVGNGHRLSIFTFKPLTGN